VSPVSGSVAEEPIWRPDEARVRSANVTRLMQLTGVADLDELRSRARDPQWLWPAIFDDLGIVFSRPYDQVLDASEGPQWARWFVGGRLNLAAACLDRWAVTRPEEEALVWESERGERRQLSWSELRTSSDALAHGLSGLGVGLGDTVGLFLPMAPEAVAAFYACAKLGATVVPIFSGYGAGAVATRILDAGMKALLVADGFPRAGKVVPTKEIADEAVAKAGTETAVVVWRRLGREAQPGPNDVEWESLLGSTELFETVAVEAEQPLLLAYTSGTTGRPKGAVLTHAGLLACVAKDAAYHLDLGPSDTACWVTDIGWIMGPWTIIAAGAAGARLCLCEGSPTTPGHDRLWNLVERERVSMLGVSPSLTRGLMATGAVPSPEQVRSVRTIGATGEPMTPAPYRWLAREVGGGRCPIINISGGTEVGGAFLAPLPIQELKVSSLGGPALGMNVDILDDEGQPVPPGAVGYLVCRSPWPSMTKGLWQNPERFLETYWSTFPDVWLHGDWASVDADGQWFLHGRSDDTLNIAGQRIGPTEIEAALGEDDDVVEAAAIPMPHEIKGEELWCFVLPAAGTSPAPDRLADAVAARVGKPFRPSRIVFVDALPRTRTGKILRRVIRAVALDRDPGDLSSLEDEAAIESVRGALRADG
jgi:acetyl-CoA synthetase